MCQICVLWNKGTLKASEVDRALVELIETDDMSDEQIEHIQRVLDLAEREMEND